MLISSRARQEKAVDAYFWHPRSEALKSQLMLDLTEENSRHERRARALRAAGLTGRFLLALRFFLRHRVTVVG